MNKKSPQNSKGKRHWAQSRGIQTSNFPKDSLSVDPEAFGQPDVDVKTLLEDAHKYSGKPRVGRPLVPFFLTADDSSSSTLEEDPLVNEKLQIPNHVREAYLREADSLKIEHRVFVDGYFVDSASVPPTVDKSPLSSTSSCTESSPTTGGTCSPPAADSSFSHSTSSCFEQVANTNAPAVAFEELPALITPEYLMMRSAASSQQQQQQQQSPLSSQPFSQLASSNGNLLAAFAAFVAQQQQGSPISQAAVTTPPGPTSPLVPSARLPLPLPLPAAAPQKVYSLTELESLLVPSVSAPPTPFVRPSAQPLTEQDLLASIDKDMASQLCSKSGPQQHFAGASFSFKAPQPSAVPLPKFGSASNNGTTTATTTTRKRSNSDTTPSSSSTSTIQHQIYMGPFGGVQHNVMSAEALESTLQFTPSTAPSTTAPTQQQQSPLSAWQFGGNASQQQHSQQSTGLSTLMGLMSVSHSHSHSQSPLQHVQYRWQ